MAYYDFKELNLNADISSLHGLPANMRIVKTPRGTELHGACPFGGEADKDGFWVDLGRKPMTWRCRPRCGYNGCPGYGKAMQFVAMREHLDLNQKEDQKKTGEILANELHILPLSHISSCNVVKNTAPTIVQTIKTANQEIPPRTPQAPREQWQRIVKQIVERASLELFSNECPEAKETLDYWHSRGIDDETLKRYKIGWIPSGIYFGYNSDLTITDASNGLFTFESQWDNDGNKNENIIRIPEGTTIPTFLNGDLFRVKVRKLNRRAKDKALVEDQREPNIKHDEHDYRYSVISGSDGTQEALFNGDEAIEMHPRPDIIFVEGEADALLINSVISRNDWDFWQAVTFGSSSARPSCETFFDYFVTPKRIVIAYDNDDAGREGALWLYSEISKVRSKNDAPIIKTIPRYKGKPCKDFGEYYAEGGDIYSLISEWLP